VQFELGVATAVLSPHQCFSFPKQVLDISENQPAVNVLASSINVTDLGWGIYTPGTFTTDCAVDDCKFTLTVKSYGRTADTYLT
jgi:hypothetical protein